MTPPCSGAVANVIRSQANLCEEEYLRREEAAEYKSEFYRGEIYAMACASPEHNAIADNFLGAAQRQLEGQQCRPFSSNQRIKVPANGLTTYPDVSIVYGRWQLDTIDKQAMTNPKVIVEVLSPTTETYDRTKRFDLYKKLPSFLEYILVSQNEPRVEQFVRQPDETWNHQTYLTLEETLVLKTIDVKIPLTAIYRDIVFPPEMPVVAE